MLPFAHIGITLVLFWVLGVGLRGVRAHVRYGYVVVGAMLPDIIDKPLGMVLFADIFGSGRIFAHALVFVVLLGAIGHHQYKLKGDSRLLVLAGGSLVHQLLDSMWESPATFLWPLMGFSFERLEEYGSFGQYLTNIYGNLGEPAFLALVVTEITGFTIIVLFLLGCLVKKIR